MIYTYYFTCPVCILAGCPQLPDLLSMFVRILCPSTGVVAPIQS